MTHLGALVAANARRRMAKWRHVFTCEACTHGVVEQCVKACNFCGEPCFAWSIRQGNAQEVKEP